MYQYYDLPIEIPASGGGPTTVDLVSYGRSAYSGVASISISGTISLDASGVAGATKAASVLSEAGVQNLTSIGRSRTVGKTPIPQVVLPGAKMVVLSTIGAGTWTVPADFSDINLVEVIGGGGGGGQWGDTGGGGGGYSRVANLSLTPGAVIDYSVGAGGSGVSSGTATAGSPTWFGASTQAASSVAANGGVSGGAGGSISGAIGDVTYPGGAGIPPIVGPSGNTTYTGGGGAAGPFGPGAAAGGTGYNFNGAGGAGAGGGSSSPTAVTPPNGGANYLGLGAGIGVDASGNGVAGTAGGGGAGGEGNNTGGSGGAGGAGTEWYDSATSTYLGAGGGGGSGGGNSGTTSASGLGGAGGLYGGGGGSGGTYTSSGTNNVGGAGAQGVIVITYVASGAMQALVSLGHALSQGRVLFTGVSPIHTRAISAAAAKALASGSVTFDARAKSRQTGTAVFSFSGIVSFASQTVSSTVGRVAMTGVAIYQQLVSRGLALLTRGKSKSSILSAPVYVDSKFMFTNGGTQRSFTDPVSGSAVSQPPYRTR